VPVSSGLSRTSRSPGVGGFGSAGVGAPARAKDRGCSGTSSRSTAVRLCGLDLDLARSGGSWRFQRLQRRDPGRRPGRRWSSALSSLDQRMSLRLRPRSSMGQEHRASIETMGGERTLDSAADRRRDPKSRLAASTRFRLQPERYQEAPLLEFPRDIASNPLTPKAKALECDYLLSGAALHQTNHRRLLATHSGCNPLCNAFGRVAHCPTDRASSKSRSTLATFAGPLHVCGDPLSGGTQAA
jgi:hypothetical protein